MVRTRLASGRSAKGLVQIRPPRTPHAQALARVTALLNSDVTHALRLVDLCRLAGVSERTLRTIFVESFGVTPGRFLRTRKLHAIRAALICADPRYETVSGIAIRFGVSDLGRMARDYHLIFGEYPHATLLQAVTYR